MALSAVPNGNRQKAYTGDKTDVGAACSLVNAGNYPGSIGTIAQNPDWRVDRQAPISGKTNLQIQKNGVGNPSTIACCLVPNDFAQKIGNLHAQGPLGDQARARFSELTRAIHDGLSKSVGSRRMSADAQRDQVLMEVQVYAVQGTFSA